MALTTNESVEDTRRPSLNCLQITDLPEEILEFILLHLSPYRDLRCAMQVNRQWYRLVQGRLLSRLFGGGGGGGGLKKRGGFGFRVGVAW